jgi:cysteinyl-tRNA synthetase
MQMIIDIRKRARENKDYQTSDQIRDALTKAGIELKDSKEGTSYEII